MYYLRNQKARFVSVISYHEEPKGRQKITQLSSLHAFSLFSLDSKFHNLKCK